MENKGKKTTIVAYVAGFICLALVGALFLDKITGAELFQGLGVVGAVATVFIGLLSKDATASHTIQANTGGHPNPKKEEK